VLAARWGPVRAEPGHKDGKGRAALDIVPYAPAGGRGGGEAPDPTCGTGTSSRGSILAGGHARPSLPPHRRPPGPAPARAEIRSVLTEELAATPPPPPPPVARRRIGPVDIEVPSG